MTQFGMSERIGYIGYAEKEYGRAYSDLTASVSTFYYESAEKI